MRNAGVTLVELLVVLVLLGMVFAVSGLALVSLGAPRSSARMRTLEAARAQALRTGIPVAVVDSVSPVVFLPDGRALGTGVDALTGALNATR